jgi:heptosyltransferase-3
MSRPLHDPVALSAVRRALVTKLRHHGDVLLAAPVFGTLKRAAPQLEIDALVYEETAPILAGHPAIARIHTIDRDWKRRGLLAQGRAELALLRTLRARRYDLLVHLTEHPRGLTLVRALRPRFAVARERTRHARAWRRHFTHLYHLPSATPRHAVEANLDALRRIGVYPDGDDKRVVLVPGAAAEARAQSLLAGRGLAPRTFVQLHPGSRWLFKCWPAQRVAALVELLASDGLALVLTGAPDAHERALADAILGALSHPARAHVTDLVGALALRELAALAGQARVFVGVDSAPMHIAAAMGTPTVALFGPSCALEWGPWQVSRRVITSRMHPCRPCGIDGCGGGKVSVCLTVIGADEVHAAVRELLVDTGSAVPALRDTGVASA